MQKFVESVQNKHASHCFQQYTQFSRSDVEEADFNIDNYDTVPVSGEIKEEYDVDVIIAVGTNYDYKAYRVYTFA